MKYSELRIKVLEKANYLCECGEKAKNVHHKNKNPKDNRQRNLVALCIKCHRGNHLWSKPRPLYYSRKAKKFGKLLKKLRFYAGITQFKLYRETNIQPPILSRFEGGTLLPNDKQLDSLAKALKNKNIEFDLCKK